MSKLLIGSHCSMASPDFFYGTVKEALSYGSTTFMFYTGAPQSSYRKPIPECKIEQGIALCEKEGIDLSKIVCHAPYIINLASDAEESKRFGACNFMIEEIRRCAAFKCKTMVLHPGAHVGKGNVHGIRVLTESLDYIFSHDGTDVKIAIETMAGKGSEIGITFEEVRDIINQCKYKDRLGVCMDTCHINDYGYDVNDADKVLDTFDSIIGLDKLLVIHVNDSKNPIGAHKDRHENVGYGTIGFDALNRFVNNPRLINIPKILETPYFNDVPQYKKEIEMFKNQKFEPNWRDEDTNTQLSLF